MSRAFQTAKMRLRMSLLFGLSDPVLTKSLMMSQDPFFISFKF